MSSDFLGMKISIQFDRDQYQTIITKLDELRLLVQQSLVERDKVAALTAQLRKSDDALSEVVAQNQPKT